MLDGYEYRSYYARFKARTSNFQEESIDTVLIVDIDQQSIDDLGNYFRWFHDYHGELIDYIESGNPKAIVFDILFDPEPDPTHDTSFVRATFAGQNVYHAIALSEADTLNFRPPMDSPPTGFYRHIVAAGESLADVALTYYGDAQAADYIYSINQDIIGADQVLAPRQVVRIPRPLDTAGKILEVPAEISSHFPSGERFDIAFIELLNASQGIGSANFPQDEDGVIRKSPTAVYFKSADQVYPSLTMAVAMDLLDVPSDGLEYDFDNLILTMRDRSGVAVRTIPIDDQGRIYVNYAGTHRTFRYLSYSWINPDMIPADYFENKVILIGSTLAGLMDLRTTPVQETFPGVEIHASTMLSYMTDEFVQPKSRAANIVAILLLGVFTGAILVHFKIFLSLALTLVIAGLWILFAYTEFFTSLIIWEVVRPVVGIGFAFLGENLYKYLILEKDKRFLRKSFSTYISPEMIDRLVDEGIEPELGGVSDILTAYFTDIQSFSSFSEILTASQLVELLNEYLTAMTETLLEHGGTLDKYEGDAIVAFFGAPLPMEDHAARSIETALDMQEQLAKLRAQWASEGEKWPDLVHEMRMRIGLNTGEFVTGNMGSSTRMNYTMMGDIVNTAARLEASAKVYGIYIQATIANLEHAGRDNYEWRDIDKVKVMGKSESVETVEIMARKGELPPQLLEMKDIFQAGIQLYKQQQWDQAKALFAKSEKIEEVFPKRPGNPSLVYMDRCDFFKADPPGDDWDGSWTLTSK